MIELFMEREVSQSERATQGTTTLTPSGKTTTKNRVAGELVKLFKLLSDETRLHILVALMEERELHVRALCDLLEQSQPAVSHHLALLRVAGLIQRRREGKHNYYRLVSGKFDELLNLIFSDSTGGRHWPRFKAE